MKERKVNDQTTLLASTPDVTRTGGEEISSWSIRQSEDNSVSSFQRKSKQSFIPAKIRIGIKGCEMGKGYATFRQRYWQVLQPPRGWMEKESHQGRYDKAKTMLCHHQERARWHKHKSYRSTYSSAAFFHPCQVHGCSFIGENLVWDREAKRGISKRLVTFIKLLLDFMNRIKLLRLNIYDEIAKILETKSIKLMTTECLKREMRHLDEGEKQGCYVASKRYEHIRLCSHDPALPSDGCILSIVEKNVNKFFVASNSADLKEQLRKLPGIPIIFNHFGQIRLEDPTEISKSAVKRDTQSQSVVSERELKALQKIAPLPERPTGAIRKRRKAKGPNPLSCKKKKTSVQKKDN